MLRTVLAHLRAQWIGVLALLIALGTGSAYAANTVFSADIVDGEVKTVDLGTNAVRSTKIRNEQVLNQDLGVGAVNSASVLDESLHANDLSAFSVGSTEIATNAVNATEIADNSIDTGEIVDHSIGDVDLADGAVGLKVNADISDTPSNTNVLKSAEAICDGHVTGGGYRLSGPGGTIPNVAIREDLPAGTNAWRVTALATSGAPVWSLRVYALCAL